MSGERSPGRNVSRRDFLKTATATALPFVVPSAVLGAAPPSDQLGIGFIGMGKMGWGHVRGLTGRKELRPLGACDVWDVRIKRTIDLIKSRRGDDAARECTATTDFRRVLDRDDIDCVLIATPNHWHTLVSVNAMKAGKDVYCEKPLTRTLHEARVVVDVARRYSRVFQTGSQQRSTPAFRLACELVRSGRIGRVKTVHVNVGGPAKDCFLPAQPTPKGLDYNMWLGPAPMRPYNEDFCPDLSFGGWPRWRVYRDYAGGGLSDMGAHHFDIAQWGLGTDRSGPVEIIPPATGGKLLKYKYADGIELIHGAGGGGSIVFYGTKGTVLTGRNYCRTKPESIKEKPIGPDEVHLYRSNNHHGNWLDCIRTRRRPVADVEIGARSASMCILGNIGYDLRRPLKWNPDKQVFIGDEDANRLRFPVMREPWRL